MTKQEATQVLSLFREGKTFAYAEYSAGVRCTFFFDKEKGSFAIREQDAHSGDEYISYVSEEALSERLERGFRREEIT